MKKYSKDEIFFMIAMVLVMIWTCISLVQTMLDPPSVYDMTVEEQIRYEQMIFP